MLIKKINLHNIRSYKKEEILFPEGSIMLSGNIGSGKSTILLSTDFALFGISKHIPGSALLRNGEKEGSVELHCTIANKDIIIKRCLKRTASSVVQDTGELTINGERKELTAMELKQHMLEILNYPQELLTKSKSMIYHYTVYAPQESMKEILSSNKEQRLEILRKVFGIDKYKRVRDNVALFITTIKQKTKEKAAFAIDIKEKQQEHQEKQSRSSLLKAEIEALTPRVNTIKAEEEEKKKEITFIEEELQALQKAKQEQERIRTSIELKQQEARRQKERNEILNHEITNLSEELAQSPQTQSNAKERIEQLKQEIAKEEQIHQEIHNRLIEGKTKTKGYQETYQQITSLAECPLCKQEVSQEYKLRITKEQETNIQKIEEESKTLEEKNISLKENIQTKKQELESLQEQLAKEELINLKKKNVEDKKKEQELITNNIQEIKQHIAQLNKESAVHELTIQSGKEKEQTLELKKQEQENIRRNLKEVEIQFAAKESEKNTLQPVIQRLEQEILHKQGAEKQGELLKQLREWLEKQFINMTVVMEKKIMLRVHNELETLLQKWFTLLVDSEAIKIRLDEEFTPIIEQNGHEIEYAHLSGGERTAAALSYRLSLNQVINTLLSTINTKDLLILDEPTDGFSHEQLDRMRNILEELNTKQTIIVSHDHKIESFVDHVIKVEKSEHVTKLAS